MLQEVSEMIIAIAIDRAVCAKIGGLSDRAREVETTKSKMPQGELKAFPCPTFAPDFDIVSWEESIS